MKFNPDSSFCILPFIHLSTRTNGAMQLCCHTNSSGKMGDSMPGCNRDSDGNIVYLKNNKAEDYWNTEFYKTIRKQMLKGEYPNACSVCYNEEKTGYRSKRVWESEDWQEQINYQEVIDSVNQDGSMPFNIKYIDMKLGNKCDLACAMCNPSDSTSWIKDYNKFEKDTTSTDLMDSIIWKREEGSAYNWWKNNDTYWNSVYQQLPNLENIYIIGGEPTINKEFKDFLVKCVETNNAGHINLRFNSNGHTYDQELVELYGHFKSVLIHLSMDGIEEHHEYIRYPSTWQQMQDVLVAHDNMPGNVTVDIDCTVSIFNIHHIPDFIKWKVNQKFKKINKTRFRGLIGLHLLHHPHFQSVQTLSAEDKKIVEQKFNDLKQWLRENVSEKAATYPKLDAVVNFMNKKDNSDKLPMLKEYLTRLDSYRNLDHTRILNIE